MRHNLAALFKSFASNGLRRGMRAASRVPVVQSLESRLLLSATVAPQWEDASRLTLSFVPDGAAVGTHPNTLQATLGAAGTSDQWQGAVLAAFRRLESQVNVSVGVVSDTGAALGATGLFQGDTRFGDIRIAAAPLGTEVFALSIPVSGAVGGTWSGDIIFNSNYTWTSLQDIYSVTLHEAGHVLGLDESSDPASMMFGTWTPGSLLEPSAGDLSDLQQLYGTRQLDPNELAVHNNTRWTATTVARPGGYTGSTPLVTWGDLPTSSDVDWFQFRAPTGYSGPVNFDLRTAGISTLAGELTVFDRSLNLLGTVSGAGVASTVVPSGDGWYLVRVNAASVPGDAGGTFGASSSTGTYALTASFTTAQVVGSSIVEAVARGRFDTLNAGALQQMMLTGNVRYSKSTVSFAGGELVYTLRTAPGFDNNLGYRSQGAITELNSAVIYQIRSPDNSTSNVLTATVRVESGSLLVPTITVENSAGQAVAAEVLSNAQGILTVQVRDVEPGENYQIRVGRVALFGAQTGDFELEARFVSVAFTPDSLAVGSLSAETLQHDFELNVLRDNLFSLRLSVGSVTGSPQGIQLLIRDADGEIVYLLSAITGDSRTAPPVLLAAGVYQVHLTTFAIGTDPVQPVTYDVSAFEMTDPIGPLPTDPNGNVAGPDYYWGTSTNTTTTAPTTPTTTVAGTTSMDYYWYWYWYWYGGGHLM